MTEITQADRDAAASGYFAWCSGNPVIPDRMKAGNADDHSMVQAFARHRMEATEALRAENERLRERVKRLGRDKETLLEFARAIQTWRSDADSYDEECEHPQRDYCEDVELMEKAAGYALRRVAERAALGDTK